MAPELRDALLPHARLSNGGADTAQRSLAMKTLPEKVSAVAGALTAVAAFVVIPGSIAMLFRLKQAQLPDDLGVVISLPPRFLIGLGLGYVVGPLLVPVGFALAVTWLPGTTGKVTTALAPGEKAKPAHVGLLGLFVLVTTIGVPFAVFPLWPPLFDEGECGQHERPKSASPT